MRENDWQGRNVDESPKEREDKTMADANKKQTEEIPYRLYLREEQIPTQWYNLRADMPEPPEPMRLPNGKIAEHDDIAPVFCDKLVDQELDDETAYFDIPEGVQEMYKVYRPSPLCRAYNLERYLNTPAKIYYKFEGNNTSGSHKLNSALAQAYYAQEQGLDKITTETGAGQWGTALSEAADHYGVDLDVFMVKCSYEQKPFRRSIMQTFNATVTPSPSDTTEIGKKMLEDNPDSTGSLGTAISEAVERALNVPENKGRYQLGSVLNQVVLHQSIIGLESYEAMKELGEYPDIVIGCAGGGSNLGGRRHGPDLSARQDVHAGQRLSALPRPCRRPALPRHEPHRIQAQARRLHGGRRREADRRLQGGRGLCAPRDHPAGAGERTRDLSGHGGSTQVRRDRRGEDDSLRPHGYGLFRHVRL